MDLAIVYSYKELIIEGVKLTIFLAVTGIAGSLALGIIVGGAVSSNRVLLRAVAHAYVEFLRNVPLIVKLFFFYFVVGMEALPAAVVSLILHQSAFIADVVAAGLRSVPKEQVESAFTTGLGALETYLYISLPQALRAVIPAMTNQFIELVKSTALVSLIGLQDLTFAAQDVQVYTYRYLEAFAIITVIYVGINFLISLGMAGLARWSSAR